MFVTIKKYHCSMLHTLTLTLCLIKCFVSYFDLLICITSDLFLSFRCHFWLMLKIKKAEPTADESLNKSIKLGLECAMSNTDSRIMITIVFFIREKTIGMSKSFSCSNCFYAAYILPTMWTEYRYFCSINSVVWILEIWNIHFVYFFIIYYS